MAPDEKGLLGAAEEPDLEACKRRYEAVDKAAPEGVGTVTPIRPTP